MRYLLSMALVIITSRVRIVCIQCEKSFVPSTRQIEKFQKRNAPLPDRCPKVSKGQICDTFKETGNCPYGEGGKFLHPVAVGELDVVVDAPKAEVRKHSYSCQCHRVGRCQSGEACLFQHEDKPEGVFYMSDEPGEATNYPRRRTLRLRLKIRMIQFLLTR